MSVKKAVQDTDIPIKVLKENAEFFPEQICRQFNEANCSSKFPATFKFENATPAFKQGTKNPKDNYRPISILPNISYVGNFQIILIISFQNSNAVFEKALMHNTASF